MVRKLLALVVAVGVVGTVALAQDRPAKATPKKASICALLKDPGKFERTLVAVNGKLAKHGEVFVLHCCMDANKALKVKFEKEPASELVNGMVLVTGTIEKVGKGEGESFLLASAVEKSTEKCCAEGGSGCCGDHPKSSGCGGCPGKGGGCPHGK